MASVLSIASSNQNTIGQIFLGTKPISLAYLGNKLIFNGEQWLNCLISLDNFYLLSSDGYKLQPKMEV